MTLVDATASRVQAPLRTLYRMRVPGDLTPFVLAIAVGVAAGLGAVAFTEAVEGFNDLLLGDLADLLEDLAGRWTLMLIPAVIALPVGILVFRFASEAKGHGVPEVVRSVETQGGRIRPRVAAAKTLASALTIGAGGSVGREGPIVQIGAALASATGQLMRQPPEMVTLMVAGGAAGGIAATFNAPIAGVFFALEVILRRFNVRNFTLVVVSAVVANMIAIAFFGDRPGIELPRALELESTLEIGLYAILGIAAAVTGIVFVRFLYGLEDLIEWLPSSPYLKLTLALLGVGALGLWHGELFGTGFEAIEAATVGGIATGTLALLLLLKVAATSLTLGGGASGGVFAPSLFLGAMLGALLGEGFASLFPDSVAPSGAYAIVGMAAVFAAAARAPMTSLFIVFELTRDYSLILPLMTGVAIATALAQIITRDTIYSIKLSRIGVHLREEPAGFELDESTVAEAMRTDVPLVPVDADLEELARVFSESDSNIVAVTDPDGHFRGILTTTDFTAALDRTDDVLTARDLAVTSPLRAYPDDSLRTVVSQFAEHGVRQLPVIARWDTRRLLGIINQQDVIRALSRRPSARAESQRPAAPVQRLAGAVVVEVAVDSHSDLIGRQLKEISLPKESVVTTIHRDGNVVIPRGDVEIEAGDLLTVLSEPEMESAVRRVLASVVQAAEPDPSADPDPVA